ncbi:MAG TPA: hypothetical protein VG895_03380 [Patescibacteria group bacterium]|nr:hypothetical protein [Patescibacteria group bacterium]
MAIEGDRKFFVQMDDEAFGHLVLKARDSKGREFGMMILPGNKVVINDPENGLVEIHNGDTFDLRVEIVSSQKS